VIEAGRVILTEGDKRMLRSMIEAQAKIRRAREQARIRRAKISRNLRRWAQEEM
jgi:hypothetical protein